MVFFNYSTQQMTAKIVYYGPGLCGKTTNLQYIYDKTSNRSQGEMVSLETDTDRTLFFDLLPIDVGSIGGFDTRVQLYTVPGQVFYNATRKLVLKGVDGIVFVADSQEPMLDSNIEAMKNLEENLEIVGANLYEILVVLQFNKRDLPGVTPLAEMNAALNQNDWPTYEASALTGEGIFETLTGISKLTLRSLRERLDDRSGRTSRPQPTTPGPSLVAQPVPAAVAMAAGAAAYPTTAAAAQLRADPAPSALPSPLQAAPPQPELLVETVAQSLPEETDVSESVFESDSLQDLARQILQADPKAGATLDSLTPATVIPATENGNGHHEQSEELALELERDVLLRAQRCSLTLHLEDADENVLGSVESRFELGEGEVSDLLLRLAVTLQPRD
jgi:signal recognition particle receptor subunit beta